MSDPKQPLRIVCDSREQWPFRFEGYPVEVTVGTLATADYSLVGFTDRIGIERKSMQDLIHCLGPDRERFTRELQRLRGFDAACIIVEQPQSVLRLGHFRSRMDAGAAWQSCIALSMRYRIPFWFCESRQDAERVAYDFLRHFHRDRIRELEALRIPARIAPERQTAQGPGAGVEGKPDTPESRTEGKANSTAPTAISTGAGT
jgi:ERCC4-type nuclease